MCHDGRRTLVTVRKHGVRREKWGLGAGVLPEIIRTRRPGVSAFSSVHVATGAPIDKCI